MASLDRVSILNCISAFVSMKYTAVAAALLLLMGSAAASNHTEDLKPGLVKADSPLYGVEVAVDNALVGLGVSDPGKVAFERASEVALAHQRGNTDAMNKALNSLDNASEAATSANSEKLNQSLAVLQGLNATVPKEAQQGLSTALDSVRNATQRDPGVLSGGVVPADLPDIGGGGEKPADRGQQ